MPSSKKPDSEAPSFYSSYTEPQTPESHYNQYAQPVPNAGYSSVPPPYTTTQPMPNAAGYIYPRDFGPTRDAPPQSNIAGIGVATDAFTAPHNPIQKPPTKILKSGFFKGLFFGTNNATLQKTLATYLVAPLFFVIAPIAMLSGLMKMKFSHPQTSMGVKALLAIPVFMMGAVAVYFAGIAIVARGFLRLAVTLPAELLNVGRALITGRNAPVIERDPQKLTFDSVMVLFGFKEDDNRGKSPVLRNAVTLGLIVFSLGLILIVKNKKSQVRLSGGANDELSDSHAFVYSPQKAATIQFSERKTPAYKSTRRDPIRADLRATDNNEDLDSPRYDMPKAKKASCWSSKKSSTSTEELEGVVTTVDSSSTSCGWSCGKKKRSTLA